MIFIGIDPGLTGAVAAISPKGGVIVSLVPTIKGEKTKRLYDLESMKALVKNIGYEPRPDRRFVVLERQHAFPGQGSTSTFSIGRGFGLWEGILTGIGIEYITVPAQRWQKEVCPGKKGESKIRAIQAVLRLFPGTQLRVGTRSKKDHTGFADAICMAEFGRRIKNA